MSVRLASGRQSGTPADNGAGTALSPLILLVEDNPADARLFAEGLRHLGVAHTLEVAPDGEQALTRLFDPDLPGPNLVVLDLNLPRRTGDEVLTVLRQAPCFDSLPVVVLTTSTAEHDREQALRNGASDYRIKPLEVGAYFAVVDDIVGRWVRDKSGLAAPLHD